MSKISVNLGDRHYDLPIAKAFLFFQGCTDAFKKMGLHEYQQLVDLVEVVRIYPNQGVMSKGQIVIEVVVGWRQEKLKDSFIVHLDDENIRSQVKKQVVEISKDLAHRIKTGLEEQVQEFSSRLE